MSPRCLLWILFACLGLPVAWAQGDVQEQGGTQAERQRIGAERARSEADFARQEQDCQARFVVQSCVDQIAAKRRKLERELKRQEASLNAAERQQRAQEQLQRGAEKARDHAQRAAELPGDGPAERIQDQQEKVLAHRKVAPSPSRAASKPLPTVRTAAEQASMREAYASKQRAAQEHRAARDKRLRESTGSAPALPTPR